MLPRHLVVCSGLEGGLVPCNLLITCEWARTSRRQLVTCALVAVPHGCHIHKG